MTCTAVSEKSSGQVELGRNRGDESDGRQPDECVLISSDDEDSGHEDYAELLPVNWQHTCETKVDDFSCLFRNSLLLWICETD